MLARLFNRNPISAKAVPAGRRIYAVGDIHGRLDLFDNMLAMIADDQRGRAPITPEIVLLGDLIDRGPDSAGVVRRAMTPPAPARFTVLMGNHEEAMINALDGKADAMRGWLRFGGAEALLSWGVSADLINQGTMGAITAAAAAAVPPQELAWLMRLRQHIRIGDYFFVHAGVRPGIDLDKQTPRDSYWIRREFLDSRRDHGAIVVHGHTVTRDVEEYDNRIGIDTGACASGKLTALALEGEDRWFLQT